MAYLTLFLPKISGKFTEKIPTFGEGGVKPVGPNSQFLPKICFGGSPYVRTQHIAKDCKSQRGLFNASELLNTQAVSASYGMQLLWINISSRIRSEDTHKDSLP